MSGTTTVGSWQGVEAAALAAFSGSINAGAPALVAAIQRATRYAVVDTNAREIVLDRRAVLFGLLSVGLQDTPSLALGNTATWFAGWLSARVPDLVSKILGPALTGTDAVLKAFGAEFAVVASVSMRGILPRAREIAGLTVNRPVADLRHFFVAMLEPHGGGWSEFSDLGWTPSDADLVAFRGELFARIGGAPERGEKMEVWRAILGVADDTEGAPIGESPVAGSTGDDLLSPLARHVMSPGADLPENVDEATWTIWHLARGLSPHEHPIPLAAVIQALAFWSARLLTGANRGLLTALRTRLELDRPGPIGTVMPLADLHSDDALLDVLKSGAFRRYRRTPHFDSAASGLLAHAVHVAGQTGSALVGPRHLVAALLLRQDVADMLADRGVDVAPILTELPGLITSLFPEDRDKLPIWRQILLPPPVQVATTRPDMVPDDRDPRPNDRLGLRQFANGIGALIAADNQKPPLSIAVFGAWGSGKSYFMRMIQWAVKDYAEREAKAPSTPPVFKRRVVPIWFNAWHYVEGNLWASLMHAILVGLRDALSPRGHPSDFETVLRKLKLHEAAQVAAEAELQAAKNREIEAKAALKQAETEAEARRKAEQAIPRAEAVMTAVWDMTLESLRPTGAGDARAWVTSIGDSAINAADYLGRPELARDLTSLRNATQGAADTGQALTLKVGAMQELLDEVRASGARGASVLGWLAQAGFSPTERDALRERVGLVFGGLLLVTIVLSYWGADLAALVTAITTVIAPLIAGLATLITWGRTHVAKATRAFAVLEALRKRVEQTQHQRLAEADASLLAARRATAEAEAERSRRQAELNAAQAAVAQAQKDVREASSAERMMRFVAERLADGGYQRHLGLIHMIRQDMEGLGDILNTISPAEAGVDGLQQPVQRIVLYIDDLDRCPPQRVVEVLEAVHLLLAFPLFVVVVGVDIRWVSQALLTRYPGQLGREDAIASPTDYLEKVFQIPFWLPDMNPESGRRLLALAIDPAGQGDAPPAPPKAEAPPPAGGKPAEPGSEPVTEGTPPAVHRDTTPTAATPPPEVTAAAEARAAAEALNLGAVERDRVLDMAEAVGISPRRTVRFANLYRLLKATLSPAERRDFVLEDGKAGTYRGALVLLALSTGAPTAARILIDRLLADDSLTVETLFAPAETPIPDREARAFQAARSLVVRAMTEDAPKEEPPAPIMPAAIIGDLRHWAPRVKRFTFGP